MGITGKRKIRFVLFSDEQTHVNSLHSKVCVCICASFRVVLPGEPLSSWDFYQQKQLKQISVNERQSRVPFSSASQLIKVCPYSIFSERSCTSPPPEGYKTSQV